MKSFPERFLNNLENRKKLEPFSMQILLSYIDSFSDSILRLVKRPKLRLWLSPFLPQLRLGKKIFHAKFWASEIAGTFVRVRLKFVLN